MSDGHGYSKQGFGIDRDSSIRLIIKTALDEGVTDTSQIAYMLATAQHETRNFTAPEEDFGRQQARELHYRGGEEYFGRGYVHLTHIENYQRFDKLLGLHGQLTEHLELAEDPEIAAKILVIGMRDGEFTSRRLDQYVNPRAHDLINARRVVNGTDQAALIASYAEAWEKRVPGLVKDVAEHGVNLRQASRGSTAVQPIAQGAQGDQVRSLQEKLAQLGYPTSNSPLISDGDFGRRTTLAVEAFQRDHRLTIDGKVGSQTHEAIEQAVKTQDVRALQRELDTLGYKDAQGQAIAVDGDFGANTRFAVEAFQRDHQLTVDGKVGPQTQGALDQVLKTHSNNQARSQTGTLLSDPRNPDNALYQQALAGVQKIDADMGRSSDRLSNNLAAALAVEAKTQGLTRIDSVAISEDGARTYAAQNGSGFKRYADVTTAQAVNTPIEKSSAAALATPASSPGLEQRQSRALTTAQMSPQELSPPRVA